MWTGACHRSGCSEADGSFTGADGRNAALRVAEAQPFAYVTAMFIDWQALYDSPLQHPGVAWFVGLGTLTWLLLRVPASSLRAVLALIAVETIVDALFTGAFSPMPKSGAVAQVVPIAFVVLGDLRLFVLVERFRRPGVTWARALGRALPWAFVVPVVQGVGIRVLPAYFTHERRIYLAYELLFCLLGAGLLVTRYSSREATPAQGRYATRLVALFLVQYVLWATCDLLILSGAGWALGLRMVPNAIYYGLFVAAAAFLAPEEARR
jgi:hypothetical protein